MDKQLFLVQMHENHNGKFITWAIHREDAIRKAHYWFGGNSDEYVVTPLTNRGDRVHLDITLNI